MSKSGFKLHDGQDLYDVMEEVNSNAGSLGFKTSTGIDIGNTTSNFPLNKKVGFIHQEIDIGNLRGSKILNDPYFDESGNYWTDVLVKLTETETEYIVTLTKPFKALWKLGSLNRYIEPQYRFFINKQSKIVQAVSINDTYWNKDNSFISSIEDIPYTDLTGILIKDPNKDNILYSRVFTGENPFQEAITPFYGYKFYDWCVANIHNNTPLLTISGFNILKPEIKSGFRGNINVITNVAVNTPTGVKYADILYTRCVQMSIPLGDATVYAGNTPSGEIVYFQTDFSSNPASIDAHNDIPYSPADRYIKHISLGQVYYHDLDYDPEQIDYSKPDAFIGCFKYTPPNIDIEGLSVANWNSITSTPLQDIIGPGDTLGSFVYKPYDVIQQSFLPSEVYNNFISPGLIKVKTLFKEAKISSVAKFKTEEDFDGDLLGYCTSSVYFNELENFKDSRSVPNRLVLTKQILDPEVYSSSPKSFTGLTYTTYGPYINESIISFFTKNAFSENKNKDFNYLGLEPELHKNLEHEHDFVCSVSLWSNNEDCHLSTDINDINTIVAHPTLSKDNTVSGEKVQKYMFGFNADGYHQLLVEQTLTQENPYPLNNDVINIATTKTNNSIIGNVTRNPSLHSNYTKDVLYDTVAISKDNIYCPRNLIAYKTGSKNNEKEISFYPPASLYSNNVSYLCEPERTANKSISSFLGPFQNANTISYTVKYSDVYTNPGIYCCLNDFIPPFGSVPKKVFERYPELQQDNYLSALSASHQNLTEEEARQFLNSLIDDEFFSSEGGLIENLVWTSALSKAFNIESSSTITNSGNIASNTFYAGSKIAFGNRVCLDIKHFEQVNLKLNLLVPENTDKVFFSIRAGSFRSLNYPTIIITLNFLKNLCSSFIEEVFDNNYKCLNVINIKALINPELIQENNNSYIDEYIEQYYYDFKSYYPALVSDKYPWNDITKGVPLDRYYMNACVGANILSLCSQYMRNPYDTKTFKMGDHLENAVNPDDYINAIFGYDREFSTESFNNCFSLVKYGFRNKNQNSNNTSIVKVITDKLKFDFPEDTYIPSEGENIKNSYYGLNSRVLLKGKVNNIEANSKIVSTHANNNINHFSKTYDNAVLEQKFKEIVLLSDNGLIKYVPSNISSHSVRAKLYIKAESPEYDPGTFTEILIPGSSYSETGSTNVLIDTFSIIEQAQLEAYKQNILLGYIKSRRLEYSILDWNYIFSSDISNIVDTNSNKEALNIKIIDPERFSKIENDSIGNITYYFSLKELREEERKDKYYRIICTTYSKNDRNTALDTFTIWVKAENTIANPVLKNLFTSNINSDSEVIENSYADVIENKHPDIKVTGIHSIECTDTNINAWVGYTFTSNEGIKYYYRKPPNNIITEDSYILNKNTVHLNIFLDVTASISTSPEDVIYSNVNVVLTNTVNNEIYGATSRISKKYSLLRKHTADFPNVITIADVLNSDSSIMHWFAMGTDNKITVSGTNLISASVNNTTGLIPNRITSVNLGYTSLSTNIPVTTPITITVDNCFAAFKANDRMYTININCIDNVLESTVTYTFPLLTRCNSESNALLISKYDIEEFLSEVSVGIDGIEYYDSTLTQNSHNNVITSIYIPDSTDSLIKIWYTAPRTSTNSTVGVILTFRYTPIT